MEFVEEKKAERLEKKASTNRRWRQRLLPEVRRTYLQSCPVDIIAPPAAELYLFEPFRAVIEDQASDYRETDGIKIFEEPMKQLDQLVLAWRAEKDSELVKMMKKARSKSKISSEHLNLATTYFKYKNNMEPMAYPQVLTTRSYWNFTNCAEFKELFHNLDGGFWNMNKEISFHDEAAAAARMHRGNVRLRSNDCDDGPTRWNQSDH